MNRAPSQIWPLRKDCTSWVRTDDTDDGIVIRFEGFATSGLDVPRRTLIISRADARLLATRLNQCLDATVKP